MPDSETEHARLQALEQFFEPAAPADGLTSQTDVAGGEERRLLRLELQSANEELATVTRQLRAKIALLETAANDIANLLNSTDLAVMFLDAAFRVRRFTPTMTDLFDVTETDIGRPIQDLAQKFADDDMSKDAHSVLNTFIPVQREVLTDSGRWYLRRTLPYRTCENHTEGVVITFFDIVPHKRAEAEIGKARDRVRGVLEQMPAAIVIVDPTTGRLRYANLKAASLFADAIPSPVPSDYSSSLLPRLVGTRDDGRKYRPEEWPLARAVATGVSTRDEIIKVAGPHDRTLVLSVSAAPVLDAHGRHSAIVGTFLDITHRGRGT